MPQIFRAKDALRKGRPGYEATYIADVMLKQAADSVGFISVSIPPGRTTEPHLHSSLEEAFVALTPLTVIVNGKEIPLEVDDILVAEPGERHSFRATGKEGAKLLAIKIPNTKDDKSA